MIALLASLSLADTVSTNAETTPAPVLALGSWDRDDREPTLAEAEAAFAPLRAEMSALKAHDSAWWAPVVSENKTRLPTVRPDSLETVAHLLADSLRVVPTTAAIWAHETKRPYSDGSWGYESWRSAYRTELPEPDLQSKPSGKGQGVAKALFWEKSVNVSRGTWTREADVLVVWNEAGKLQTVFESERNDLGPLERLSTLEYDAAGSLAGVVVTEVQRWEGDDHGPRVEGDHYKVAR